MSLAYDMVVATVVSIVSVVVHFMSVELFAPGGVLYGYATDGTSVIGGPDLAWFWFQILAVWIPLLVGAAIWLWVFIRAYRRQAVTGAVQRVP